MRHDLRRTALLRRLKRVREIETLGFKRELARARGEEAQLAAQASHAEAQVRVYSAPCDLWDAGELGEGLRYAAALCVKAGEQRHREMLSREQGDQTLAQLRQSQRQCERIDEQLRAHDADSARQIAAQAAGSPRLARRLQSKGEQSRPR